MTNAEKLRQSVPTMSDEELVRVILGAVYCDGGCDLDIDCIDCARNWLNSEAK